MERQFFAHIYQISRERSKKTEGVFLVCSRESEGKSKSLRDPNCKPAQRLRFGKEEMSTEDKRRRSRRLVPPWSFLTRLRFLLEKQKKMLDRSRKFAEDYQPSAGRLLRFYAFRANVAQ